MPEPLKSSLFRSLKDAGDRNPPADPDSEENHIGEESRSESLGSLPGVNTNPQGEPGIPQPPSDHARANSQIATNVAAGLDVGGAEGEVQHDRSEAQADAENTRKKQGTVIK